MELVRIRAGIVALLSPVAFAAGAMAAATPARAESSSTVPVIVSYAGGSGAAERAVLRAGGAIRQRLGVADAFTATLPRSALPAVASAPGVRQLTADGSVRLAGKHWNADTTQTPMSAVNEVIGTADAWGRKDSLGRPITGTGIGVALVDSGVTPVKGLDNAARIINGPDLSFESQAANLRHLDTYGHGTHMAGIILGRDAEFVPGAKPAVGFAGVAPGANLINLKVAAVDGSVDVSQVIAAIDWAVTHRNDPGLNIRVLNLSFGTDSLQDPKFDPLSYAVEAAWRKGIVVVVAAGNGGPTATRLGMPAMNPTVIAVGGSDHLGTAATADDVVGAFSSRGSTARRPDLVAPGRSVISLRDPNSFIDTEYSAGRLTTVQDPTQRFFKGSGTSQSAAVVSGAVALLLQQRPTLTPDQVKKLLTSTAAVMPAADSVGRGAGQLSVKAAISAPTPTTATQLVAPSVGTGSLEKARGTAHVIDPETGIELTGERDIMGKTFNSLTWGPLAMTGCAWTGGTWNTSVWTGAAWTATSSWSGKTWSAGTWTSGAWSGKTWSGRTWSSVSWTGKTWTGKTWSGKTWSGKTWSGGYWSGSSWG
jgi:serine protease AprX